MTKSFAFTLAEVLVTVGIIGVLAALTLPTLLSNYQNSTMAVQIKKFVTEFESGVDMQITEEGKTSLSATSIFKNLNPKGEAIDGIDEFMRYRFNVVSGNNGFSNSYRPIRMTNDNVIKSFSCPNTGHTYILNNSVAVCINKNATDKKLEVYADINGTESPNVGGIDMYYFEINNQASLQSADSSSCTASAFGVGCIQLMKNNGWRIDY